VRRGGVLIGNHAQATAIARAARGGNCHDCDADDAPRSKMEATRTVARGLSHTIVCATAGSHRGPASERPWRDPGAAVRFIVDHRGVRELPPLELSEEIPHLEALVTPVGAAAAVRLRHHAPRTSTWAFEFSARNPPRPTIRFVPFARASGLRFPLPARFADGLRSPKRRADISQVQRFDRGDLLVSEDEIRAAVKFLLLRMKIPG